VFIKEIVGTDGRFTTGEVTDQIRNILVARFSDALAESAIPVLDMAANLDELGTTLLGRVTTDLTAYGLELRTLLVENVSLPPAVEEALDKRTSMGVIGDLSKYMQYQTATAVGDAAKNPGGGGAAAAGIGAGLGMAMAGQMMNQGAAQQGRAGGPPPLPAGAQFWVAVDGQQVGPFDAGGLKEQIRGGKVKKDTLVWTEGMAEWASAEQVDAVAKLFGAVPPPLPR
jgi:membrane protease subunit (stomatin/prohibitin family)